MEDALTKIETVEARTPVIMEGWKRLYSDATGETIAYVKDGYEALILARASDRVALTPGRE